MFVNACYIAQCVDVCCMFLLVFSMCLMLKSSEIIVLDIIAVEIVAVEICGGNHRGGNHCGGNHGCGNNIMFLI